MGVKPMTYEEAARILDPETNLEALRTYAGDCEARQAAIVEACRMGARAIDADELEMFPYSEGSGTEEQIAEWIEQAGLEVLNQVLAGLFFQNGRDQEGAARVVEDGVGAGQASGSADGERPGVPQAEEAQRGGAERAVEVAHDEDRRRGAGALEGVDFRPKDGGRSPALPLAPPLAAPHGGEVADEDVERVASGEHALAIEDVAGGLLLFSPLPASAQKQSACRNEQHPKSWT